MKEPQIKVFGLCAHENTPRAGKSSNPRREQIPDIRFFTSSGMRFIDIQNSWKCEIILFFLKSGKIFMKNSWIYMYISGMRFTCVQNSSNDVIFFKSGNIFIKNSWSYIEMAKKKDAKIAKCPYKIAECPYKIAEFS